ncbi:type VII secretion protein EccE [Mycolicibacterium cosmeticum]|uniref:Type VII secretion protein EccE n=1 Tax=Mycolicibacterium cosmeticum TaxID=258533 RepID=W9ATS5_MYCCO|nr:type VII secretion protein EccE [Mycolicibacterium cosmeticum]TLH65720.1 type VII secretion protein EccE [Mycolicibacterium cosmeticum]CDO09184.1 type VII secretion protein EccE [Mycolicibacterium cosmeticum]
MTARLALALLFIIPAALAYPWPTVTSRWVLGVAITVVILVFAWWRGEFVTTLLGRRLAIVVRNARKSPTGGQPADRGSVLLRIDGTGDLPVPLIAGYVDRYGLRCDKVRITSRDQGGQRQTWVGLTLAAEDNLPALQARSAHLPLHDTVDVIGRRLAGHLREHGWTVTAVEGGQPAPVRGDARESWRALADDAGFVAAYRIPVQALPELLDAVWASPAQETWTAVEFGVHSVAAVVAFRTAEAPGAAVPVPGLARLGGRQRPVLDALELSAAQRLDGHGPATPDLPTWLSWPVDAAGVPVRT